MVKDSGVMQIIILREYHDRVTSAVSNSCAVVFDVSDFGEISSLEIANISDKLCEHSGNVSMLSVNVDDELLPGRSLDMCQLQHLTEEQRTDLLHLLDEFSSCFSETPGFC
jgi:hypothetical protein